MYRNLKNATTKACLKINSCRTVTYWSPFFFVFYVRNCGKADLDRLSGNGKLRAYSGRCQIVFMGSCCDHDCSVEVLHERQRGTLRAVLAINVLMFVAVMSAAFYADSSALLADSLDNLGDALTYGLSLYAVARGAALKAGWRCSRACLSCSPRYL